MVQFSLHESVIYCLFLVGRIGMCSHVHQQLCRPQFITDGSKWQKIHLVGMVALCSSPECVEPGVAADHNHERSPAIPIHPPESLHVKHVATFAEIILPISLRSHKTNATIFFVVEAKE